MQMQFIRNKLISNNKFNTKPKICFITAIYGNYEVTCKKFINQTIPTDFICFTDNKNIVSNGWIIDTTPYHIMNPSKNDTGQFINSISNNKHTFNIAKYYKQSFQNIPILNGYDVVVWLDGTIEIIDTKCSEWLLNNIHKYNIITWKHEFRDNKLKLEVDASNFYRYTSTFWNNQSQPYQDIFKQYETYINDGYGDVGVWVTCFVAFNNKNQTVSNFLDRWYLQTLEYTTQDQIGFPYTCFKEKILPYTLPDNDIFGDKPHRFTQFYIKHNHGI